MVNWTDPNGRCAKFDDGRVSTEEERHRCGQQRRELRESFGITAAVSEDLLRNRWTVERIQNLYSAVSSISNALGSATRNAIGDTEVLLVSASPGSEAARASTCSRIRLFLSYKKGNTSYTDAVHTVANIVHEFGHIFTQFRNTAPQDMWRTVSQAKTGEQPPTSETDKQDTGIGGDKGWNFELRENKGDNNNLVGEQVPDMFMFWVLGYGFSDDEFGQIREDYVKGGSVRNLASRPTDGDNPLVSPGMHQWAEGATPCNSQSAAVFSDVLFVQQQLSNGMCGDLDDIFSNVTTL